MAKTVFDWVMLTLIIIGSLNWGLVGLLNFDLVEKLFGEMTIVSRVIYSLVGVSALWMIYFITKE
jgi:hypothetical protein